MLRDSNMYLDAFIERIEDIKEPVNLDNDTKSKIIESIFLRLRLPQVAISISLTVEKVSYTALSHFILIRVIKEFCENRFILSNLEHKVDANDKSYKTLPRYLQRRLEELRICTLEYDDSNDCELEDIKERIKLFNL